MNTARARWRLIGVVGVTLAVLTAGYALRAVNCSVKALYADSTYVLRLMDQQDARAALPKSGRWVSIPHDAPRVDVLVIQDEAGQVSWPFLTRRLHHGRLLLDAMPAAVMTAAVLLALLYAADWIKERRHAPPTQGFPVSASGQDDSKQRALKR